MQIELRIDESCREPRVVIIADGMTEEVSEIMRKLTGEREKTIAGFRDGMVEVLDPDEICRISASGGKVYAQTSRGEVQLRLRLYELEQRLDGRSFVRISNSEIINLKKVKGFDLSMAGTICVLLSNGDTTYVSRRYVARIKQILGI
ncbi:MAG: LytTR family DNA-binding domain-containing protein [Candidatus Spyradocola sp.]